MKQLKMAIAAVLIIASCIQTLAQNNPKQVIWLTVQEALDNPNSAYAVKIIADENEDYAEIVKQISALPHITNLCIEVYGIIDMPANINLMDELEELTIINKDWFLQPSDSLVKTQMEGNFNLVWYDKQKQYRSLKVTYISFDEGLSKEEMTYFTKIFPEAQTSYSSSQKLVPELTDQDELSKITYNKTYNYVKPPIKGVDVPKNYYSVDPISGGIFQSPSGTTVSIPSMAFTDTKGNPVLGSVAVSYREFKDVAEMIASGIPMTYDSGGVINHFESAGMFELLASQNGNEVFLAKDKKIDMDFTSTSSSPSFNFYSFDDSKGNWDYLGDAGEVKTNTNGVTVYSDAWSFYRSRVSTYKNVYDSTPFYDRFYSNEHFYMQPISSEAKVKRTYWTIKDKKKAALLKFYTVKRTKEGNVIFKIKWFNQTHPELSAFSGLSWMTEEKMTTSQFRKMVSYKNYFNDIRIEDNGEGFSLQLKSVLGMKTINAHPVKLSKDKKKITELKDGGMKRYKNYKRQLSYREKYFNKMLKKGRLTSSYVNFSNTIHLEGDALKKYWWKQAKYQMAPAELAMNFDEWESYVDNLKANEKGVLSASKANSQNIIRSLTLDGFGIFNCDQIQRLKNGVSVAANFISEKGVKFAGGTVYIVNKAINGVLTFAVGQIIAFSKSTDNTMIVTKPDGTLSVAGPEAFKDKKFSNNASYTFNVNDAGNEIKTVGDLRAIIGF